MGKKYKFPLVHNKASKCNEKNSSCLGLFNSIFKSRSIDWVPTSMQYFWTMLLCTVKFCLVLYKISEQYFCNAWKCIIYIIVIIALWLNRGHGRSTTYINNNDKKKGKSTSLTLLKQTRKPGKRFYCDPTLIGSRSAMFFDLKPKAYNSLQYFFYIFYWSFRLKMSALPTNFGGPGMAMSEYYHEEINSISIYQSIFLSIFFRSRSRLKKSQEPEPLQN